MDILGLWKDRFEFAIRTVFFSDHSGLQKALSVASIKTYHFV